MDSISRTGLLALLRANTMTQAEIIKLVELMPPPAQHAPCGAVETDDKEPWHPMGMDVQPDLMNWPASVLAGLG
ncbi:hypothetical protein [Microcoleus phage My-WqHQDG]|nr:hypothetical protein [Microcoleus phage My-WqHQDG]